MDTPQHHPSSGKGLAIATVVVILATIAINTLSNLFPPGGQNVGEIANTTLAGVLITPANFAFAIWGLIYLGLLAYGIYQFHRDRRRHPDIQRVDQLLIGACIAQIIWIYLFTFEQFGWSIVAMVAILLPLIAIYQILNIGRERVSRHRRWMAQIPFSLYLAWIAVATIVNVASALYAVGWQDLGLSGVAWTVIMVLVAAALGAIVLWQRRDVVFTLVFVWALTAIALRHSDNPTLWVPAAGAAVLLLVGVVILQWGPAPVTPPE
jgi:hypothetical protein